MMLKKRKLEKRLSSQNRTAGHGSESLTEAKEYINAVLYQDFRATEPFEWWRQEVRSTSTERCFGHAGLAVVEKKTRIQESLLDDMLMYHLNKSISR
ncbi:hypothetical protein AAVH_32729 [Aphelenchoides avenae]|nr:hypothetical protein AAVH_32729 [Aphelenchus avenae]